MLSALFGESTFLFFTHALCRRSRVTGLALPSMTFVFGSLKLETGNQKKKMKKKNQRRLDGGQRRLWWPPLEGVTPFGSSLVLFKWRGWSRQATRQEYTGWAWLLRPSAQILFWWGLRASPLLRSTCVQVKAL